MEFLEKLTNLTADAARRANNALENGRLNLKINSEENKIAEFTLDIGELMVDKLDGGLAFDDDEIKALYSSILAARETIADYQAEIEANRPVEVVKEEEAPRKEFCSNCGAPLAPDAKFCNQCGTKVVEEAPVVEAAAEKPEEPAPVEAPAPAEEPAPQPEAAPEE